MILPDPSLPPEPSAKADRKGLVAWCVYDWANTAFGTVIITFIYAVYFAEGIIGDKTEGAALWAYTIGFSGMAIALFSPIFGAIADHTGSRKPWLLFFTILCAAATSMLWFGTPGMEGMSLLWLLLALAIANFGLEMGITFYNAMLPDLVSQDYIGRLSGIAWGAGYFGGLACLVVALFGLVGLGETAPFLTLSTENSEHLRAVAPLTALWLLLFSLPLFLFTPDRKSSGLPLGTAIKTGLHQLVHSIKSAKEHSNLAYYLVGSAIYRDGLNTLFTVGGVFAAGAYGMDFEEILIFAIGLNVTAGLGAAAFAYVDDKIGSKPTILMSLAGLTILSVMILMTYDKDTFMILGLALGIFVGPAQAAGRTLAGRLAPPDMVTQTYGLYAFTGKSISFVGPLIYGLTTDLADSQRAGIASIIIFWVIGAALLLPVKEKP